MGEFSVLTWTAWQGDAASWDGLLGNFPDGNIYQSYAWGEHRGRFGWMPYRLTATEGDRTLGMAQWLVRRTRFGVAMAWAPGGPVGNVVALGEQFRATSRQVIGARHLYCRINPLVERTALDVDGLKSTGWRQPEAPLNSPDSFVYVPTDDEPSRLALASGNWRHNLRRALKHRHAVEPWPNPDPEQIHAVYAAMQAHKGLAEQFSLAALKSIMEAFGDQCLVVRCMDTTGRTLALRGALLLGNKGWDILAAATPEGRKVYASHAAFWELMRQCAGRGVRSYDMSGADSVRAKGVHDFKRGTGARAVTYLGEWDWATSSLLRRMANYVIKYRARVL